jgi:hypothetical protein
VYRQSRLERLEREYFPDSKRTGYYLWELKFVLAFKAAYKGREDSAPKILRGAYNHLMSRTGGL